MKILPSVWLIVMSAIWHLHGSLEGAAAKSRGLSNALQLEADLYRWAETNAPQEAVREIFDEDRRLLLGGDHPTWTFRQMTEHLATDSVPPLWPAVVGYVLGIVGLWVGVSKDEPKNDQPS
jgi:hypothetical protein